MSDIPAELPREDVLNILIASDIHLGYAEKDSIRGKIFMETDVMYILCGDLIVNCLEYG
jgi:predicted phosphodiesterase